MRCSASAAAVVVIVGIDSEMFTSSKLTFLWLSIERILLMRFKIRSRECKTSTEMDLKN